MARGTLASRLLMAFSLTALVALQIQAAAGLREMHFGVFVTLVVVDVGGFGAFVVGVCFGGRLPIDGGPIASASVSGSTGSAGIGSTPRAYASAQASTVAT